MTHDPIDLATTLERHVARCLVARCGVRPGDRLVVAVSGGADSVALLHLAMAAAPRLGLHFEVASFDHALRPESSDDAAFVADLAADLGVPFHTARWSEPKPGEAAARAARHDFLANTAAHVGAAGVLLGHSLDDQVETMLLRLDRGTGLRGWGGMDWRRAGLVPLLRPLLAVPRSALAAYLRERRIPWREDTSNQTLHAARNRVRALVLPALDAALRPGWRRRWGATAAEMRAVSADLEDRAQELLGRARVVSSPASLACKVLTDAPAVVLVLALRRWIEEQSDPGRCASDVGRTHLDALMRNVQNGRTGRTIEFPGGGRVVLERDCLVYLPVEAQHELAGTGRLGTLETLAVESVAALRAVAGRGRDRTGASLPTSTPATAAAYVAGDAVLPPLSLRFPRPGDRVRLLGAPGSRRLRRILQDRAVPARLRAAWPVVTDGAGILWVPGIGIADRARVRPESAGALELRYRGAASDA